MMASRIAALPLKPQLVIASPALRAIATANIFTQHLNIAKPETHLKIYDASEKTLLAIINGFYDKYEYIALVGHNPGISQILYYLTGSLQDMDTAGVALIELEAKTWGEVSGDTGTLISYNSPGA